MTVNTAVQNCIINKWPTNHYWIISATGS